MLDGNQIQKLLNVLYNCHLRIICHVYFYLQFALSEVVFNSPQFDVAYLTHFFPNTDPSVCKHSIILSHMAICSIISSQFFRYKLVHNYFADTANPKGT